MSLLEINKTDVAHASFKHIVSLLSDKQQWQGEGLDTRWKVAPSRNLKADGKERRVPHEETQEQQEKATTPQQPASRGRQRTRMDPNRNAKVLFEVVWKTGTEKSLGIELIPRKGSGMVGQKDVVRTELQEGALLNSVVTTSYIRDATYVTGGQHLRKGCRLMSVNGDPVARLPFRQVLEHLLVNQRPLVTTWKLAPSRSLTPEGKLRQERMEEKKHARIDHETQQRTTVSIVLPTGEEPLGLVLVSRKPRSATMKRMVAGGLSGCGTMVAKIEKNSFFNGLNKRKCIRKGMRLGMVGGINVDTHTVVEVQRMIVEGRKQGSVTCKWWWMVVVGGGWWVVVGSCLLVHC